MRPAAAASACARAGRPRISAAACGASSSPRFRTRCRSRSWSSSSPTLIENKKAPLLGDVRDESAEDIRLVLEPKARTVEPAVLMESLFKLTALETRVSLNMNVLDADGAPRVMSLKEVLRAFLDHRRDVLQRRTAHPPDQDRRAPRRAGRPADRLPQPR